MIAMNRLMSHSVKIKFFAVYVISVVLVIIILASFWGFEGVGQSSSDNQKAESITRMAVVTEALKR